MGYDPQCTKSQTRLSDSLFHFSLVLMVRPNEVYIFHIRRGDGLIPQEKCTGALCLGPTQTYLAVPDLYPL